MVFLASLFLLSLTVPLFSARGFADPKIPVPEFLPLEGYDPFDVCQMNRDSFSDNFPK